MATFAKSFLAEGRPEHEWKTESHQFYGTSKENDLIINGGRDLYNTNGTPGKIDALSP